MADLYYGDANFEQRVFMARAITTAMVAFSTAAGTGGPLLWNNNTSKTIARILKVGFAVTTASTVSGAIGFTGGYGQTAAPSATTAIDSLVNTYIGSNIPASINAYRIGTVSTAGAWFCPIGHVSTAAVTAIGDKFNWIDVNRLFTIPPSGWLALSASATLTTAVIQAAILWEEVNTP